MAFRAQHSPTNKFIWILGKTLGQLLFVLVITAIIIIISVFAFGMPLNGSIIDLIVVLLLVAVCFIGIALVLSNLTNTFSTIVLGSLLLIVPMLFLSGIFFPIEFMPEIVAGFSNLLPLTISKNLFTNVIIKGLPLAEMIGEVLILTIYSIVFFAASLISKKY